MLVPSLYALHLMTSQVNRRAKITRLQRTNYLLSSSEQNIYEQKQGKHAGVVFSMQYIQHILFVGNTRVVYLYKIDEFHSRQIPYYLSIISVTRYI